MYRAAWLSQNNIVGLWWLIFKSFSSCITQVILQAILAIALYYALAEDLDTTPCFLDLQDIKESPKYTAYLVRDLQVSGHPAQSASQKALICNSMLLGKKIPFPGEALMNWRTLCAANKCGSLGYDINWLSLCTTYVMFGLVKVKYSSLSISLLYVPGSASNAPSHLDNLRFCSIGNWTGLHPRNLCLAISLRHIFSVLN